jgi:hypothetical protein
LVCGIYRIMGHNKQTRRRSFLVRATLVDLCTVVDLCTLVWICNICCCGSCHDKVVKFARNYANCPVQGVVILWDQEATNDLDHCIGLQAFLEGVHYRPADT